MKKMIGGILCTVILLTGCGKGALESGPMPTDKYLIIAHRGASAYIPENTLESYDLAEDLDADYIELDIHMTKDRELVVMHDKDVAGTTEASGDIENFTQAELKELTANFRDEDKKMATASVSPDMYNVPTLVEVFSQFGGNMNFIIELKNPEDYPGIEEKLIKTLQEFKLIGIDADGNPQAVVQSFDEKGLKRIVELNPDIPLLKLISFEEDEKVRLSTEQVNELKGYAAGIGVSYEAITEDFITDMQKQGLAVYAYTVNDTKTALKMKEIGANGIHTDRPDVLDR